jgi:hypothetical protein
MTERSTDDVDLDLTSDSFNQDVMMGEAKGLLKTLPLEMIRHRMEEQTLLSQSVADGGPGSTQEAFINLMDYCKIGVRALSKQIGVKRTHLQRMLNGEMDMPMEVTDAMIGVFSKIKPDLKFE